MLRLGRFTPYLKKYAGPSNVFDIRSYAAANQKTWIPSYSVCKTKDKYISFNMPAVEKMDSDDGKTTCVLLYLPGVKREDDTETKAHVEGGSLRLEVRKYDESYFGGKGPKHIYKATVYLPENSTCISSSIINTEMQDGLLKVTLPKLKYETTTIFTRLKWKFTLRLVATIPSVVTMPFARLFMICIYCPYWFNSFTLYKKATAGSLYMRITPGLQKIDYNTTGKAGASVSINMPELKIEDVKSFFRNGTLFIRGKNKTAHYVTGISLPEGYCRGGIVKSEMQDGTYKATIPFVSYYVT